MVSPTKNQWMYCDAAYEFLSFSLLDTVKFIKIVVWKQRETFFSCPADSSIGDLVTHSLTHWLTHWATFWKHNTRWPQRLVTLETFDQADEGTWPDQKKTNTKTNTKTKTMTKTNTFIEHHQRATPESCDLWDIWSEWWGDMNWPTKIWWKWQRQRQRQRQKQRQKHLENTFKEWPHSLVTFEIFDQSDEGTWPDQQNDNDKDNYKDKDNDKAK